MMLKSRFCFFGCTLTYPFIDTLIFGILKVFSWYISGTSFICVWFAVHEFWSFKSFQTRRKYNFRLLLGGFLGVTHWNVVKFVLNFHQWCSATSCIKHVSFYFILKKTWNWAKQFSGSVWEVFGLLLFTTYELHPDLLPN